MRLKDKATQIQKILYEEFPNAGCELNFTSPFTCLVAVMLSAQTTDKAVNQITPILFEKYPDVYHMAEANIQDVYECIQRLGLANAKSKNLVEMSKKIVEEFKGEVPNSFEKLITLPGVGRKTANVVLCEVYQIPRFAVDTHVERVSKRLGLAKKEDSPLQVEERLMKLYDPTEYHKLHHSFIFFGRYACFSRNPKCENCRLKEYCKKK